MAEFEDFTEYGYIVQYANGDRCAVSPLSGVVSDEEGLWWMDHYAEVEPSVKARGARHVLVSRRVTRTAWADVEQPEADRG